MEILDSTHSISVTLHKGFLSQAYLTNVRGICHDIMQSNNEMFIDKRFKGRKLTVDPWILKQIQHEKLPLAEDVFGLKLQPSFTILSMYFEGGNMYDHFDREMCEYMINISIYSNCEWGLKINDNTYYMTDNEAIFMSGTHHKHGRKGTLKSGEKVYNAFIYYMPNEYSGALW